MVGLFQTSIPSSVGSRILGLLLLLLFVPALAVADDPPPPIPVPLSMPQPYRICTGDRLEVVFALRIDVIRTIALVRPDGMITLPFVDDVQAAGLRLDELSVRLREEYSVIYRHPKIHVLLRHSTAARAFVGGEVDFAGIISLRNPVTVREALTMAGGITSHGALSRIVLVRKKSSTETEFYELDLTETDQSKDIAGSFYLAPGDILLVPMKNIIKVKLWASQYVMKTLSLTITADFFYFLRFLDVQSIQR